MLDVRYGCGVALGEETARSCRGALLAAIQTEHARQVQRQAARCSDIAIVSSNAAHAGHRIASSRESLAPTIADLRKFVTKVRDPNPAPFDASSLASSLYDAITQFWEASDGNVSMQTDPMIFFSDGPTAALPLVRQIALDALAVPVGDAPSERIFSICSRIIRKQRARMSPRMVAALTFVKKNRIALSTE